MTSHIGAEYSAISIGEYPNSKIMVFFGHNENTRKPPLCIIPVDKTALQDKLTNDTHYLSARRSGKNENGSDLRLPKEFYTLKALELAAEIALGEKAGVSNPILLEAKNLILEMQNQSAITSQQCGNIEQAVIAQIPQFS